ncbi:MAG: hypothetical protein AAF654_08465 [Myxococcota bacterium]
MSFTPRETGRDPTVGVVFFLGIVLIGLMIHFGIRAIRESDGEVNSVRDARLYRVTPEGPTLAEGVADDAAVDTRLVDWRPGPPRGPMRGVRAIARKGKKTYEYRFDIDLETGAVHPSNPRSERVFKTLRAREPVPE